MAEIYTSAELLAQIQAVDVQITDALKVHEYDLETGQSKQRFRRQKLSELTRYRAKLVARYEALQNGTIHYLNDRF